MKASYRKYNNGGPVNPKKKQKVYTDRGLYEKALKSYQDSLALNNYYKLQQEVEPPESAKDKAAFEYMQELVRSGERDTSDVPMLKEYGNRIIKDSDGRIQWAGNSMNSYSPDLQYYTPQDDPDVSTIGKIFDKLKTNSFGNMINGASKYWLGNAYNAEWPEPNIEPVYLREDGLKELPPRILEAKAIKPRKEYKGMLVDPLLKESRVNEEIIQLPPKLPFNSMDLSKPPALRRVLPEFYSRKMDASGTKVIYETSEGRVVKKKGSESAQYEYLNRAAINRMRQNR